MVRWGHDSDWKEIRFIRWGEAVGIKRDGSMWEWVMTWRFGFWSGWVYPPSMPSQYADWVTACPDRDGFLALARDGTLARWKDPARETYYGWHDPDQLLMPSRINARRVADLSK